MVRRSKEACEEARRATVEGERGKGPSLEEEDEESGVVVEFPVVGVKSPVVVVVGLGGLGTWFVVRLP